MFVPVVQHKQIAMHDSMLTVSSCQRNTVNTVVLPTLGMNPGNEKCQAAWSRNLAKVRMTVVTAGRLQIRLFSLRDVCLFQASAILGPHFGEDGSRRARPISGRLTKR